MAFQNVQPLNGGDLDQFDIINPSFWEGKDPPKREWMVEGLFPKGVVAMLSGNGGLGKSLLMQQLCTAAAIGRDWLGLPCVSAPALHLACEDDRDELWRRQVRINEDIGCSMTQAGEGGLMLKPRVGQENDLCWLDRKDWKIKPTPLYERLYRFCTYEGVKYVVIDTATATYAGNQNDERQVVSFVSMLRRLAVAIQGIVILTKHPSVTGRANGTGESGSVAWENSVRARCYLHTNKDGDLVLKTMKSNYGPKGNEIRLHWEDGVFRPEQQDYSKKWFD